MSSGRRDTLVQFQRATTEQDGYGEEIETWADIGEEWSAIFWGRGDERRQAAQETGSQSATFQVLDNGITRGVQVKDRIAWEGTWDITGVATPKRGEIEFTAVRAL